MTKLSLLSLVAASPVTDRAVLARAGVWGAIGLLYGFLYTALRAAMPAEDWGVLPAAIVPAVVAAAWGALIYGSMRLTVLVSLYAAIAVIICFLLVGRPARLEYLLLAGGILGAVIGAVYGLRVHTSRVSRAEAKVLAGGAAGLLASSAVALPAAMGAALPLPLEAFILCPLSALLYIGIAPACVHRFSHLLPPAGDGLLVGGGAGVLMGFLFWVMAGTLDGYLTRTDQLFVDGLVAAWPLVTLAAAAGGLLVGLARSLLGVAWYDL